MRAAELSPPGATRGDEALASAGAGERRDGLRRGTLVALGAATLLALAIRVPLFADVPGYTDETEEVLLGLRIAQGHVLPLTNMANYIGPLWNYVLAATFLVVGPSPDAARALMVLVGTACVPLAGWLAAREAGTAGGLAAAGLTATSALEVLLGSHVAWSVCLTPLLFTLTLGLLQRAAATASGRGLVVSGLIYGLAVHAHPVVAATAPGLLAALLAMPGGRRMLSQWRWLAVATVLLGLTLAPVALDVLGGQRFLRQLEQSEHRSTFAPTADPREAATRLPELLVELVRASASTLQGASDQGGYLLQPRFALFAVWLLAGVVLAARRRAWLLVLPAVSYLLLWSAINQNFGLFFESRYTIFLLPALYAAMALPVAAAWSAAARLAAAQRRVARVLLGALLAGLIAWPLGDLASYDQRQMASDRWNVPTREAVQLAGAKGGPGSLLLVDTALKKPGLDGGSTYFERIVYARTVSGALLQAVDLNSDEEVRALRTSGPPRVLLLSRPAQSAELGSVYDLRELQRYGAAGEVLFVLYEGQKRG